MADAPSREGETREESESQSHNVAPSLLSKKTGVRPLRGVALARLQDRRVRKNLFIQGRKVVTSFFVLYFCENQVGKPRYAVYAGKRLGGAVERNRIKRLFRESLFLKKKMLNDYDFILVPREAVRDIPFHEIASYVHGVLLDNQILKSV
ncbi:MAG: ribonuclease P protein component [Nitrospirota bacterium]